MKPQALLVVPAIAVGSTIALFSLAGSQRKTAIAAEAILSQAQSVARTDYSAADFRAVNAQALAMHPGDRRNPSRTAVLDERNEGTIPVNKNNWTEIRGAAGSFTYNQIPLDAVSAPIPAGQCPEMVRIDRYLALVFPGEFTMISERHPVSGGMSTSIWTTDGRRLMQGEWANARARRIGCLDGIRDDL